MSEYAEPTNGKADEPAAKPRRKRKAKGIDDAHVAGIETRVLTDTDAEQRVNRIVEAAGEKEAERNGTDNATATPREPSVFEVLDDPHRLARGFLRAADSLQECPTPRIWRGEWYDWRVSWYQKVEEADLRAQLTRHLKAEFDADYHRRYRAVFALAKKKGMSDEEAREIAKSTPPVQKVTKSLFANAYQALTSLANLPGDVQAPAWIAGEKPYPAAEILVCPNALVHLPSLVGGKANAVLPPTPTLFTTGTIGCEFDAKAPGCPSWITFLREVWPDDKQAIDTLQEWFGYSLTGDTSHQKILFVVGPRRSGKSTIVRILRALVGTDNTCAPTLSSLGLSFGLQPLLGKSLATISDARLSGRSDMAQITERLLSISGEDGQTVERKHLPAITVPRLPVKFVILTNELPRLQDSSGALVGRLVILQLTRTWYGKEDLTLGDRLVGELPGILLWTIEGWRRLRDRGHFTQPESARRQVDQMEELASPVTAFVRDRCEIGQGKTVWVEDLYPAYCQWADTAGMHKPTRQVFGRDLHAAFPGLETSQPRIGETRVRVYLGISLRPVNPFADTPGG